MWSIAMLNAINDRSRSNIQMSCVIIHVSGNSKHSVYFDGKRGRRVELWIVQAETRALEKDFKISDVKKGRGFHVTTTTDFKNTRHFFQTRMSVGPSAVFTRENKRAALLEYWSDEMYSSTLILKCGAHIQNVWRLAALYLVLTVQNHNSAELHLQKKDTERHKDKMWILTARLSSVSNYRSTALPGRYPSSVHHPSQCYDMTDRRRRRRTKRHHQSPGHDRSDSTDSTSNTTWSRVWGAFMGEEKWHRK